MPLHIIKHHIIPLALGNPWDIAHQRKTKCNELSECIANLVDQGGIPSWRRMSWVEILSLTKSFHMMLTVYLHPCGASEQL